MSIRQTEADTSKGEAKSQDLLIKGIARSIDKYKDDYLLLFNIGGPRLDLSAVANGSYHVFDYYTSSQDSRNYLVTALASTETLETFVWWQPGVFEGCRKLLSQEAFLGEVVQLIEEHKEQGSVVLSVEHWNDAVRFLQKHGPLGLVRNVLICCKMPVDIAPRDQFRTLLDGKALYLFDIEGGRASIISSDSVGGLISLKHLNSLDARFSDVKSEGGYIYATLTCSKEVPDQLVVVAKHKDMPVAITQPKIRGEAQRVFQIELELPRRIFFDSMVPNVTLHIGSADVTVAKSTASLPARRFVNAEELLNADFLSGIPQDGRKPFGIILYTFTRTEAALLVLESLKKQGMLHCVEVWMDGDQGNPVIKSKLDEAEQRLQTFGVSNIRRHRGNLGFRKLILHSLFHMSTTYERFIILEDDCFPSENAVAHFQTSLDRHADDPSVLTTYGSHFSFPQEQPLCPRFQPWGWASWGDKLLPVLHDLAYLYSLPEQTFIEWAKSATTPEIVEAIDCIPQRAATDTITRFFAWDEALCLLAALRGQKHAPTDIRCIYNFGVGEDSTHFTRIDYYRKPPFNMVLKDEVWDHFYEHSDD